MADDICLQILVVVEEFGLDQAPPEVIENILVGQVASEFDTEQLNVITKNVSLDTFNQFTKLLREVTRSKEDEHNLWGYLTGRKYAHKTLLGVLCHLIQKKRGEQAFAAAGVYLLLLQIPGSMAYNIFHPLLFRGVLNLLKSWQTQPGAAKSPKAKKGKAKAGSQRKGKRAQAKEEFEDLEADEDGELGHENEEGINKRVVFILEELQTFLEGYTEMHQETFSYTLEVLADLTRFKESSEPQGKKGQGKQAQSLKRISHIAYDILKRLLRPVFTSSDEDDVHELHKLVREVFKNILPNILMSSGPTYATIPAHKLATREHALAFVTDFAKDVKEMESRQRRKSGSSSDKRAKHNAQIQTDTLQELYSSLHALLQHLCAKVPEKADYRAYAGEALVHIFGLLPNKERPRFVTFLTKYSRNAKVSYRAFAVQLAQVFLEQELRERKEGKGTYLDEVEMESKKGVPAAESNVGVLPLLDILVKRASDKVATVRAKALQDLGTVLQMVDTNPTLRTDIERLLQLRPGAATAAEADKTNLLSMLQRRIVDEKATVRKAAIQTFEALGGYYDELVLGAAELRLLADRCSDPAVSIRKQAMIALGNLMRHHPSHPTLYKVWLSAVLPLVADPEATIIEKCLDEVEELVFERVVKAYKSGSPQGSVWLILQNIDSELARYLQRIGSLMAKGKRLKKPLCDALQHAVKANIKGAWALLSEVSRYCKQHIDVDLIVECWDTIKHSESDEARREAVHVLSVLEHIASCIPASLANSLADDLLGHMRTFQAPPNVIQAMIQALAEICRAKATSEKEAERTIGAWAKRLLAICDKKIVNFVLQSTNLQMDLGDSPSSSPATPDVHDTSAPSPDQLISYLFTLGEVSQICPKAVPKRLVTVVQALVAPTLPSNAKKADTSTTGANKSIPPSVRGYAFVALGKLCLEDEALAKKCIAAFAKELETSDSPVVRNNVMVIMCDLCIRYTSLVDRYVPNLAACMRDQSELVRRQTLLLLTRLLQEDYVKWKGPLFYRFVVALVDESPAVRQFATFCLTNISQNKNQAMFFNHFTDTVFHLTDHNQHPLYNQQPQSTRERELFSLKGANNKRKRQAIYKIMLQHMTEEQKFNTTAKLCQDVLGGVVDGLISLDSPTASDLIQDTLEVLMSKDIKINNSNNRFGKEAGDGADADDGSLNSEEKEKALAAAKGKLLSKIVKKNVIENIVPIIIHLKHLLEEKHSPLLGPLMQYLTDMMKDYKNEISDIMTGDKQLAKELDYDLRQYNIEKTRKKRMSLMAFSPAVARQGLAVPVASPMVRHVAASPMRPTGTSAGMPFASPSALPFASPQGKTLSVPKLRNSLAGSVTTPKRTSLAPTPQPSLAAGGASPFISPAPRRRAASVVPVPSPLPIRLTAPASGSTASSDILLPSPFKETPPPRGWGVKLPLRLPNADGDDNEEEIDDEEEKKEKEKEKAVGRRQSKKSTQTEKKGKRRMIVDDEDDEGEEVEAEVVVVTKKAAASNPKRTTRSTLAKKAPSPPAKKKRRAAKEEEEEDDDDDEEEETVKKGNDDDESEEEEEEPVKKKTTTKSTTITAKKRVAKRTLSPPVRTTRAALRRGARKDD